MKIVHDGLGTLELPEDPKRIVSLAPNATETLYRLGLGARLVGRSAFCYRPEAANALPVVASYTKVRWRLLEELSPDLILTTTGIQRDLTRTLHEAGYPVFPVPLPHTPWGILENVGLLGGLTGTVEAAARLSTELAERYARLANRFAGVRVYFEFDFNGPISVGRGSYIDAALSHLGMVNVYGHRAEAYFVPDLEEVARLEPELVIYEPKPVRSKAVIQEKTRALMRQRGWVYPLVITGGDEIAHYGPQFFAYLEALAEEIACVLEAR
ncbi:helical backbone metal receptor [Marinithermus hydrothermalis]|uniref:ABC-type transporter, periplasmic subunit n=1 Tax=Marinithermus hydrothermalis (strain DSM 14884 / JCM 11576 / T1) TaxID=869210 RepID=F2NQI9_MARHT|nr:helical backbone metal receptor [Marinithermus hydrothermalis]AEB11927.1 ABC-type transporter, periplasmic subunit [Marinithermus hydrothermalis DSM 14884]